MTVSQWADAYRQLSRETSAAPGPWSTARAEYQRGVMDAMSDPTVHTVVVPKAHQVGYTEMLGNMLGFHIHQFPSPILVIQPTERMAEAWSQERLDAMLRDTPVLRDAVADPRSRDSGNSRSSGQTPRHRWRLARSAS
jgi:phage terminase large subunit GpA-like protein